jgi:hypothetical protein
MPGFTSGPPGHATGEELFMNFQTSHLRPDGTAWPPVTPDPPPPPGYVDSIPGLDDAMGGSSTAEPDADAPAPPQDDTTSE